MIKAITLFFMTQALILSSSLAAEKDEIFYGEYKLKSDVPAYNFLPIMKNQNQPTPCESSWAFAITSTMSTHFKVLNKGKTLEVDLSPQMLINCSEQDFNCENADNFNFEGMLDQLKTFGVAEESCNNYHADNLRTALSKIDVRTVHLDIMLQAYARQLIITAISLKAGKKSPLIKLVMKETLICSHRYITL